MFGWHERSRLKAVDNLVEKLWTAVRPQGDSRTRPGGIADISGGIADTPAINRLSTKADASKT